MLPTSRCIILVPVGSAIDPGCEDALRELERRGYAVWRVRGYSAIDAARNQMASDALAQGFDELMWIDSDGVFDLDDVDKLRHHNLPLVCGICAKKSSRQLACAFLPQTRQVLFGVRGGLMELLYGGFGFMHTRRVVYETMQRQLELPLCNQRFQGSPLVPYFAPLVVGEGEQAWYLNEDFAFCERARRCGFRILADTTIRLWHVGSYRYGWEDAGRDVQRFGDYTFYITHAGNESCSDCSYVGQSLRDQNYPIGNGLRGISRVHQENSGCDTPHIIGESRAPVDRESLVNHNDSISKPKAWHRRRKLSGLEPGLTSRNPGGAPGSR
jgi:hypothetical protein